MVLLITLNMIFSNLAIDNKNVGIHAAAYLDNTTNIMLSRKLGCVK